MLRPYRGRRCPTVTNCRPIAGLPRRRRNLWPQLPCAQILIYWERVVFPLIESGTERAPSPGALVTATTLSPPPHPVPIPPTRQQHCKAPFAVFHTFNFTALFVAPPALALAPSLSLSVGVLLPENTLLLPKHLSFVLSLCSLCFVQFLQCVYIFLFLFAQV